MGVGYVLYRIVTYWTCSAYRHIPFFTCRIEPISRIAMSDMLSRRVEVPSRATKLSRNWRMGIDAPTPGMCVHQECVDIHFGNGTPGTGQGGNGMEFSALRVSVRDCRPVANDIRSQRVRRADRAETCRYTRLTAS